MNGWEILLVSLGLSLDVCAAMICEGAVIARWEKWKIFCAASLFTLWQVLALLTGSLIRLLPWVSQKSSGIQMVGTVLSIMIFTAIGIYMLRKAWKRKPFEERRENETDWKALCFLAIVISLDALFAGVGLAIMDTILWKEALALAISTILAATLGAWVGYRLGAEQKEKAYLIGGILLVLAGLEAAVNYLQ
ncbi:manganese efflux pump MntP [Hominifimenecus sp. rT4P-3]|uniref:manganese efflux pump MntP n=1 Tax=Hominifimenecus sp. rT4P-3 TaxID=3242979 RepID=UPI003DA68FC4